MWCVLGRHPEGCVLKDNRSRLQGFHGVYFGCRAGEIRYNCTIYIVVLSIWWITLPIHPEHLAYPLPANLCLPGELAFWPFNKLSTVIFKTITEVFFFLQTCSSSLVKAFRGIRWVTLIAKAGVQVQFNKLWILGAKNCLEFHSGSGNKSRYLLIVLLFALHWILLL